MTALDARWTEETVRLYRRYEQEIVEAHDFCPWASRVRRDGRMAEEVLLQKDDTEVAPTVAVLNSLPGHTDLALLFYPRMPIAREDFERFAARVRDASGANRPAGTDPWVLVAFHPDAQPRIDEPERLVPFLRRTPDPTLQVVRSSVLDRVRASSAEGTQFVDTHMLEKWKPPPPTLRERIAQANLTTTLRIGIETLAREIDDIIGDRVRTHAALEAEAP